MTMFRLLNNLHYIDNITYEVVHMAMVLIIMNYDWRRPTWSCQGCGIHCKLCLRIFIHNMDFKAFNSAKWSIDCFPRENVDSDRLDHVNFFHLCVSIPPCQPNSVNNLHVHRLPCSSHNMLFKVSKGGLEKI